MEKIRLVLPLLQRWDINDTFLSTVHEAFEMFGASRCMFATNYPVDNRLQGGYWSAGTLFAAFQKVAEKYSSYSRQLLWNGTAQVDF